MGVGDESVEFGEWEVDTAEYRLEWNDPGEVRAPLEPGLAPAARHEPKVSLPRSLLDCVSLDALRDHPAVTPLVLAQLDQGMPFRLLRLPFSLRRPDEGRVDEIRFTVQLGEADPDLDRPYVHSIFPSRIQIEKDSTTEVAIEPSLTLGAAVEVGARVGRTVTTRHARATLIGFWSEHGADWILRRPEGDRFGLEGTWEMLLIVRWTGTNAILQATVALSAVVTTSFLRWATRRIEHSFGPIELTGCLDLS